METLRDRIRRVCNDTKPGTQARKVSLSKIRWRLESVEGLCAGLDQQFCCALVQPENAQIFDGRDNEDLKKRFYEAALGVELSLILVD